MTALRKLPDLIIDVTEHPEYRRSRGSEVFLVASRGTAIAPCLAIEESELVDRIVEMQQLTVHQDRHLVLFHDPAKGRYGLCTCGFWPQSWGPAYARTGQMIPPQAEYKGRVPEVLVRALQATGERVAGIRPEDTVLAIRQANPADNGLRGGDVRSKADTLGDIAVLTPGVGTHVGLRFAGISRVVPIPMIPEVEFLQRFPAQTGLASQRIPGDLVIIFRDPEAQTAGYFYVACPEAMPSAWAPAPIRPGAVWSELKLAIPAGAAVPSPPQRTDFAIVPGIPDPWAIRGQVLSVSRLGQTTQVIFEVPSSPEVRTLTFSGWLRAAEHRAWESARDRAWESARDFHTEVSPNNNLDFVGYSLAGGHQVEFPPISRGEWRWGMHVREELRQATFVGELPGRVDATYQPRAPASAVVRRNVAAGFRDVLQIAGAVWQARWARRPYKGVTNMAALMVPTREELRARLHHLERSEFYYARARARAFVGVPLRVCGEWQAAQDLAQECVVDHGDVPRNVVARWAADARDPSETWD